MLTALLSLVIATSVLVLILLAAVVAGIRREHSTAEMDSWAPDLLARMARRLLGVYVRRPDPTGDTERRETCLAGHATDDEGR